KRGGREVAFPRRGGVVQRLSELERALDVLARRLEVALPAVAPRAPAEDVAAEQVARQLRRLRELQRLAEERNRGRDAGEVVAADAHPEEHLRTVDVREAGPLGDRAAALQQLQRRPNLAALHPRPRLGLQGAGLELDGAGGEDGCVGALELLDGVGVLVVGHYTP